MLQFIKKILPKPLKEILIAIKSKTIDSYQKKKLAKRMQKKHQELLASLKGKKKIRVVFLAIHKSVWKVDTVFQRMLADPFFEPEILVCPYTPYGEERMLEDMEHAYNYFKDKGYPITKSLKDDGSWVKLEEIQPDIVFFTNPHHLTRKEYYEDAYLNYLSCYVPYHHEVGSGGDVNVQFNQLFHNAMWRIYSTHKDSYDIFRRTSYRKGGNVEVTGFPAMEVYFESKIGRCVWKNTDERLRIIWAPHHTISESNISYSNFIKYSDLFCKLANKYQEKVVWAFKPHPVLKSKLYMHRDWGIEKTNKYYDFWNENNFTQLEDGEYSDLFLMSDAMIHDSGSFLGEYLYMKKPVMYLISESNVEHAIDGYTVGDYTNFGIEALKACEHGYNQEGIIAFIDNIIEGKNKLKVEHLSFLLNNVEPYFNKLHPSDRIIKSIAAALKD